MCRRAPLKPPPTASVRVPARRTWSEKRTPNLAAIPSHPIPGGRSEPSRFFSIPDSRPGRLVGGTWTAPCAAPCRGWHVRSCAVPCDLGQGDDRGGHVNTALQLQRRRCFAACHRAPGTAGSNSGSRAPLIERGHPARTHARLNHHSALSCSRSISKMGYVLAPSDTKGRSPYPGHKSPPPQVPVLGLAASPVCP